MRRLFALLGVAALSGCVSPPLMLPEEPLERAATCTAVRTLELREGQAQDGPLSFDGFTEILHFSMLFAAEDAVEADLRRVAAVSQRIPGALREAEAGNWASLVEPCNAAYPESQRDSAPLPSEAFEAGMTCFALADFLGRSASDYPGEQRALAALAERALRAAQPMLRERASDDSEAHRIAGGYASRAFKAGRPASLADQCRRRFPVAL